MAKGVKALTSNGNSDPLTPVPTAPGGGTGPPPPGPILASDMTLRDWFAGQVLSAIGGTMPANDLEIHCYNVADRMLTQREVTN